MVWYDTTALITINSDKNLIATRVTGRDYSRKELVSNGDIKFTVSGQITSGKPDIYPAEEMQKFYKIMQYKGIVKINNMVLDQLGITHIVIENFNVSPRQGYKALNNTHSPLSVSSLKMRLKFLKILFRSFLKRMSPLMMMTEVSG